MELRDRINYLLKAENLKQKDLAEKLNASAQTVNNWLKRNSISRKRRNRLVIFLVIHLTGY
ncbi:helix-turn-helix domain containing protein [Proteus mirabilis]|uniref:Helix-turn-helix domain containing protein n=1 Tax=Proteus mirabilis TaxID=584 RepID=A0ABD5LT40_PROMI